MGVMTVVKDYGTSILNAIRDNDLKTLRSIFEKHLKSDHKISALCVTDIKHKPTKKFACPLILAARLEDPSIIKYMMDKGVDPNFIHHTVYISKRKETVTALHIAVDLGLFSTVEVLLNVNADPNITDHNDETSLHIAVKKADHVMTRMLLAKGADSTMLDRRGNAPLHVATLYGHLQMVKTLLKYDADVYQNGYLGAIPSHIAAQEGHIHLVQVFCSRDVGNVNIKIPCYADQREKAPIHLAAENGYVETVIALIDQFNAEVNLRDSDGNTPLHCVVLNPYHPYKMRDKDYFYATAKVLIRYRVSINEKNKFGETALHLAAANHYQKIVELLLSIGANPFAENDRHLKPIDVVLESDPVTKQLLKNAMSNPKAALSTSMLSLQKDLNLSAMGLPPMVPMTSHHAPTVPNWFSAQAEQKRGSASIQSVSSLSSVFIDDMKARQMSGRRTSAKPQKGLQTAGSSFPRNEHENEIQLYTQVNKTEKRERKEKRKLHGSSSSILGSQLSVDSQLDQKKQEREKTRHQKSSTIERQNAKNNRRTSSFADEIAGNDEEISDPSSPVILPPNSRHHRKGHHSYENLNSYGISDYGVKEAAEMKQLRKEQRRKKKHVEEEPGNSIIPYRETGDYSFGENEGVKVHTIPGKPSMIEVQYDRGPITISVDTYGNGFEGHPEHRQSDDSEAQTVWQNGVNYEDEEQKSQQNKISKRGKDGENIYANQQQIVEEMRRKQHQKELLKRRKSMEEREMRLREEAERRREEQEEEERRARREEEKERKRAKKQQRKKLRQEQFEQEQELEGMPTEEEPPERPHVLELPQEVLNEPSFDSDSFEAEQESSKLALIRAAKHRLSETTESIRKRWSHDENEESEDEDKIVQKLLQATAREQPSGSKYTIKPPRPIVSQANVEMEEQENKKLTHDSDISDETEDVEDVKYLKSNLSEVTVSTLEVRGQERVSSEINHLQIYETRLHETTPVEVIRMEIVPAYEINTVIGVSQRSLEEELLEYDQEPNVFSPRTETGTSSAGDMVRYGLNMRVTGEVPKAYNRMEKNSARTAFMLASPVGIESSSEASDSEIGGSRSSLTRSPALLQSSAQRQKDWLEQSKPIYGPVPTGTTENLQQHQQQEPGLIKNYSEGKKKVGAYAKPYESFGPIKTRTDALEEAILEAEKKKQTYWPAETSAKPLSSKPCRDTISAMDIPNLVLQNENHRLTETENPEMEGMASTVQRLLIPVVSQVKETDIVSSNSENDTFDDESFDQISEPDHMELETVSDVQVHKTIDAANKNAQLYSDVHEANDSHKNEFKNFSGATAAILLPSDLLKESFSATSSVDVLSRTTENLNRLKDGLEVYEEEPGARKPRPKVGNKEDKLKTSKASQISKAPLAVLEDRSKVSSAIDECLPEDDEVARINSVAEAKLCTKKMKKAKKIASKKIEKMNDINMKSSEPVELENMESNMLRKLKGRQKKTVDGIVDSKSNSVWKEAMESKPLASSEMFESEPTTKEHFMAVLLANAGNGDKILSGSNEVLSVMPKKRERKRSEKKQQLLVDVTAPVAEQLSYLKKHEVPVDVTEEDIFHSNNLDIVIPPVGSKWKNIEDQSLDNSLDIKIPMGNAMYFESNGNAVNGKWKAVALDSGIGLQSSVGDVNLDEIFIPGPSEISSEDTFSVDQETVEESPKERIVGRREQRLTKQNLQASGTHIPSIMEHETDFDDISNLDIECSQIVESKYDTKLMNESRESTTEGKSSSRNLPTDEETRSQSLDLKALDQSFEDGMDVPMHDVEISHKPKILVATGVVKPPLPQKPSLLSSVPYFRKNTELQIVSMASKRGAEIVEMPFRQGELGFRPISEPIGTTKSTIRKTLPRYPPASLTGNENAAYSDTEVERGKQVRKYGRPGQVHSEAEASDLEMPVAPGPEKSYRQAALETINRRPRGMPSFVLVQPGHHDKNFAYVSKLYKPQKRHSVTRHLTPSAGRYGDSELLRMARRSATESEGDTDNECSYLFDEYNQNRARHSAPGAGRGKVVTIHEGRSRRHPGQLSRKDEPPRITEPGPVDFRNFDVTARLWMEQVDRKTVQKSLTMYLSVLPEGQELPEEIMQRAKYQSALSGDSSVLPPQWVMARGRTVAHRMRSANEPKSECGNLSGYESDLNLLQMSSPGRQLILFFKVGSNWLDLAWVLFDGVQGDSDTVRMIKDIQLKNPDRLVEQVHDLMHRWWKKKGSEATIEELQKALDTIHLAYIHEEYIDPLAAFVPHTDTEDDLDVGVVSDCDPNVSRIVQEYELRSLNASFVQDSSPPVSTDLNPEIVLRKLQQAKSLTHGSTTHYTRASRSSRAESRDSSFERVPRATENEEKHENVGDEKKLPGILVVSRKLKKKKFKHETNL